jgi:hypothetical protein
VHRWHGRVQALGRRRAAHGDMEAEHDFVYAFFQNCHHLRHWLEADGAASGAELDRFIGAHPELRLCRDICNGTKHLRLSRPSLDADFSIGREYVPAHGPGARPHVNETWFVIAGGEKRDLFELADRCLALWVSFTGERVEP